MICELLSNTKQAQFHFSKCYKKNSKIKMSSKFDFLIFSKEPLDGAMWLLMTKGCKVGYQK
jgi:hypothetical protein